jgi:hypothetical protein
MPPNGTPSNVEVMAKLEALTSRFDDVAKDAREGRDLARSIKDTLAAQDMPARLEALRGEMNSGFQGARADLVNAQGHIRQEIADHDKRIAALEQYRQRADGASGTVAWLMKHAPWLVAIAMSVAATVGLKDKLP